MASPDVPATDLMPGTIKFAQQKNERLSTREMTMMQKAGTIGKMLMEKSTRRLKGRESGRTRSSDEEDEENETEAKLYELRSRLSSVNQSELVSSLIDPESKSYRLWLGVICLLSFYSSSEALFTIAFYRHYRDYYAALPLAYVIDLAFAANVFIHLRTGFFDPVSGEKVMDRQRAARHYLYSARGVLEISAAVPFDVFQAATGWNPLFRLPKILRLYSMPTTLRVLSETSVTPRTINLLTIVRMFFLWLVASHAAACVRILFAAVEGYGGPKEALHGSPITVDTWNLPSELASRPLATQYLHALYWCMGLMTGMATTPLLNTAQFMFTTAVITAGAFVFAFSVGAIGAIEEQDEEVRVGAAQRERDEASSRGTRSCRRS